MNSENKKSVFENISIGIVGANGNCGSGVTFILDRMGLEYNIYDRNSDMYLNSDKTKSTSDDRPFHDLIRWNILHITDKYFAKMKTENGFYDTDVPKKRKTLSTEVVPRSGVLSESDNSVSTGIPPLRPTLENLDEYDTREKLLELLCILHNKPGDKQLMNTFDKLASSDNALKCVITQFQSME